MFWIFFCVFCLLAAFVFVFREDATLRQFAVCEPFGFGICVKCNANGKDDPASFDNYHKMHPHMGQTNTKAWYLFCANVSSSIYLFLCVCMYVCNVRRTNNDIINRRKGKKRDFWIASHGHQMSIGVFSSISLDENALVFFFYYSSSSRSICHWEYACVLCVAATRCWCHACVHFVGGLFFSFKPSNAIHFVVGLFLLRANHR